MDRLWSLRWIASHLFAVAAVLAMTGLGFWQLRRLDDRRTANAAVSDAISRPPVDIGEIGPTDADTGADGSAAGLPPDYTVVTATGVYSTESEVLIGHRSYHSQPGSWLATPMELRDGRTVLVVRGWVPRLNVAGVDTRPTAPPGGVVTVTGLAFASVGGGRIAVTDAGTMPEISRVDLGRFEEITGLDVADMWIRLTGQFPPQQELPVPVPGPDLGDGPHLSYALQWFFLSAGAVVVYVLILRRTVHTCSAAEGGPIRALSIRASGERPSGPVRHRRVLARVSSPGP